MAREILVVERDALFGGNSFQGFVPLEEKDFLPVILGNFEYRERDLVEEDPSFQQAVPYVWIINPKTKKVFAYQRAPDKKYDEVRLRGKWSCGIGGHVDKTKEKLENPLVDAMMRELREEVTMEEYPKPKVVGYINDDETPVGKVHFGVVALAETARDVKKGSDEMTEGRFYSVEELEKIFLNPKNDVETWTRMSWPFIKEYLKSL